MTDSLRPQDAQTPAEIAAVYQRRMNAAQAAYVGVSWLVAPEEARAAQARMQREARTYVIAERAARGDDVAAELLALRMFDDAAAEGLWIAGQEPPELELGAAPEWTAPAEDEPPGGDA